jgi:hypothetical protein
MDDEFCMKNYFFKSTAHGPLPTDMIYNGPFVKGAMNT